MLRGDCRASHTHMQKPVRKITEKATRQNLVGSACVNNPKQARRPITSGLKERLPSAYFCCLLPSAESTITRHSSILMLLGFLSRKPALVMFAARALFFGSSPSPPYLHGNLCDCDTSVMT